MHVFFKRKLLIVLLTFILLVLAEMAVYLIIFQVPYAQTFLLEIGLYIILLIPAILVKSNKISIAYTATVLGLTLLLFAINISLDYASRDIFTFAYLNQVGEAVMVFDLDYVNWLAVLVVIGFSFLYTIGVISIYKYLVKGKDEKDVRYLPRGAIISLGLLTLAMTVETISLNSVVSEYSSNEIFEDMSGYQIIQYLSRYLKKTSMKKYGVLNYSFATAQGTVQIEKKYDEIIDDSTKTPVTDEYYGLLKDYNVIEIMIESGAEYLLNETLTPNLYKLASEGIYFTNNASKNKTNVSEFIGINGSALSNVQYFSGQLPYSAPNILKQYGYKTSYFHNNYGDFYNRNNEMVILGFENINFTLDINEERQWYNNYNGNYPLDSETIDDILENLAPVGLDSPYYSFWTSLSMHGPYIGMDNWNKFIELGYVDKLHKAIEDGLYVNPCLDDPEAVQAQIEMIMCETMDFDVAIGKLLAYLEKTNQMDNTLLILYGDHDTYFSIGIDRPLKEYVYNCEDETYPDQYQTMLFMYNKNLTKKYKELNGIKKNEIAYYNDFTSPYVIIPTMFELLGIDYNPDYYTGVSIFQTQTELDNVFYSSELCSLFTDKIYTIDVSEDYAWCIDDLDKEYSILFQKKITLLLEKIDRIENMYMNSTFKEKIEDEVLVTSSF